jgi:transposase-like protein
MQVMHEIETLTGGPNDTIKAVAEEMEIKPAVLKKAIKLAQLSKEEIVDLTQESTLYNLEFISKKGFYEKCEYAKKYQ